MLAISNVKVEGIQPSQPQSSKSRYVPPHCRGGNVPAPPTRASVSAINNAPAAERSAIPGLPIGYKTSQGTRKKERDTKRATQHKAKIEASNTKSALNDLNAVQQPQQQQGNHSENQNNRQRNRPQQNNNQSNHVNAINGGAPLNNQTNPPNSLPTNQIDNVNNDCADNVSNSDKPNIRSRRRNNRNKDSATVVVSTGDPEKDKQIRARIRIIQQKLRDIVKLKAKRDNGDGVDANQLSKINTEVDLVRELNALKLSA